MSTYSIKRNLHDGALYGVVMATLMMVVNLVYVRLLPASFSPSQLIVLVLSFIVLVIASGATGAQQQSFFDAGLRVTTTILIGLGLFVSYAFVYIDVL